MTYKKQSLGEFSVKNESYPGNYIKTLVMTLYTLEMSKLLLYHKDKLNSLNFQSRLKLHTK